MKIFTIVIFLFTALLLNPVYSVAQTCMYCKYQSGIDRYHCAGTCTSSGQGCAGCCKTVDGGTACYVGGCCIITPGVGGICYDKTGVQCGNFSCTGGTTASQSNISVGRTQLASVNWIRNSDFPVKVGHYSKSFEKALTSFQLMVTDSPEQAVSDNDVRRFSAVVRTGFPATVTVSHTTSDKWVVALDRADTEAEGIHAPIMLEILGNQWTLISHPDEEEHKIVVATSTIE